VADNCKNFSGTFAYMPKSRSGRDLENRPKDRKPHRPHPLLLAYRFQELLNTGAVNTQADLARRFGVSRARITQMMSLLKLPPDIQEEILQLPEEEQRHFTERKLRETIRLGSSEKQRGAFARLLRAGIAAGKSSPRPTEPQALAGQ